MAADMCNQMGYKEGHPRRKEFISKISEKLFKRNVEPMRRLAGQKIDATTPKTFYCSVTAQFFGIIEVQKMSVSG
jgi:hypothetical protein